VGLADKIPAKYLPLFGNWSARLRHSEAVAQEQDQDALLQRQGPINYDNVAMRVAMTSRSSEIAGKGFNLFVGGDAGFSYDDTAEEIKAKTGVDLGPLEEHRQSDGTIRVDDSALVQQVVDKLTSELGPTFAETQEAIAAIDAEQTSITALLQKWDTDRQAQELKAAQREFDALQRQLKIDAARSSVQIISTAIGFGNPKLAEEVSVTGNAMIQVAEAFNGYSATAARLGDLAKMVGGSAGLGQGLASVVLTGNVVGAALQVFDLFSRKGPSPEQRMNQMLLEQIQALRQQVEQLRTEMHDRFDRVDLALNRIYDTIEDRFDKVDWTLGVLTGDMIEIQSALFDLQADLNRLESRIVDYLDDISRMDLRLAINYYLGYEAVTGLPMPYSPEYLYAQNLFYTWVTDFANDELHAGPLMRDFTPGGIYDEFQN